MKMYYCTMYGDINIESNGDDVVMKTTELSYREKGIVREMLKKYHNQEDIPDELLENNTFTFNEFKLEDVHKHMKKLLKGNKPVLTAVKYKDGEINLVESLDVGEKVGEQKKDMEAGVTVDKPNRGCPMPVVLESEKRASRVLDLFLNDIQKADYEKYLQFVSKGANSGKPYLVTSRWCKDVEKHGQLYDLVDKKVICASCSELPPSEELLSMKLMIEFREKEFVG